MGKLLTANMFRLKKSRIFWLSVTASTGIELLFCILQYYRMLEGNYEFPMDVGLFVFLQCSGMVLAVLTSVFLGTDYADGTLRNKLIAGHGRCSVYCAGLFTLFAAVSVIYAISTAAGVLWGLIFFGKPFYKPETVIIAGIVGWAACMMFVSLFSMMSMLISSKATAAIVTLLSSFLLLAAGVTAFRIRTASVFADFSKIKQIVIQNVLELNPHGQVMEIMSMEIESPLRLLGYALFVTTVSTMTGILCFRKKELK